MVFTKSKQPMLYFNARESQMQSFTGVEAAAGKCF